MPAIVNGTNGITFPTWTTGTRPATPATGQAGFNTTIGAMETYNGTTWSTSDLPAPSTAGNFLQSTGTAWTSASTLGVSNGGTGVTTLTTAYGVLAAGTTATGALQNIGTGTANQVLTSNGPGVLPSWAAAAGGQYQAQIFTGPGTWTKPASVTQIKVTVVGGGAGGNANGQAGGCGGLAAAIVPVSAPVAVTVGAGSPTTAGSSSSFGAFLSATGGGAASPTGPGSPGTGTVSSGTALSAGTGISNNRITPANNAPGYFVSYGLLGGQTINLTSASAITFSVPIGIMAGAAGAYAGPPGTTGGCGGAVVVEYIA